MKKIDDNKNEAVILVIPIPLIWNVLPFTNVTKESDKDEDKSYRIPLFYVMWSDVLCQWSNYWAQKLKHVYLIIPR